VHDPPKDFDQFLRETFPAAKTICSTAPEVQGNLRVDIGGKTVHPAQGVMTLTVIYWHRNNKIETLIRRKDGPD
jgi:hypothetical protein